MSDGMSKRLNYTQPTLLDDGEIYLAFTPRFARNEGDLFGRLNLNRQALNQRITTLRNGKFTLDEATIESWSRLENALLDLSDTLLQSIQPRPPALAYPKFPWECGYRNAHASRDAALRCAIRAQQAFLPLSAVATFSISLYMDDSGGVENAYTMLRRKSTYKVHPAWWDLLTCSYVCNFSPNFRVGGFMNPYQSQWMGHVTKFTQARISIWILWGHNYHLVTDNDRRVTPADRSAYHYYPPRTVIEEAKARSIASDSVILPVYRYDPFSRSQGLRKPFGGTSSSGRDETMDYAQPEWALSPARFTDENFAPSSEMPMPASSSPHSPSSVSQPTGSSSLQPEETQKKQALLALEKFFADVELRREAYLKNEPPADKQRRVAREEMAKNHVYAKKSTFFVWEEQEDGTYRREKVNSKQVSDEWENFTRNQRRYTGHLNQWDLCPQLPRYSEENRKETQPDHFDDSDSGSDEEPDPLPVAPKATIEIPNDSHRGATFNDELRCPAPDSDQLEVPPREVFDFEAYLRDRFGYDLHSPDNWRSNIERAEDDEGIPFDKAMSALSCKTAPGSPNVKEAVVRLVELLSTTNKTFSDLPPSFDYSPMSSVPLSLASDTLTVKFASQPNHIVYVVHEQRYVDRCPWSIATLDASTVLLIFRRRWPTVADIARNLVERGVPFRTVAAITVPPAPIPFLPLRGLGARPEHYKPTAEDYSQYLQRRNDLLRGPKGRAALMRGGIVARIARDVIESNVVLDGPSTNASAVAEFGRFTLVDDELADTDIDIICGVYYVKVENAPTGESFMDGTRAHVSWWPRDRTWVVASCYSQMEWTERAEEFYQARLETLRTQPETAPLNSTQWKKVMRKFNTLTKKTDAGAIYCQAGYLEEYHRRTRFVSYYLLTLQLLSSLTTL